MFILIAISGAFLPDGVSVNPPWGKPWEQCNIFTLFFNDGKLEIRMLPNQQLRQRLLQNQVPLQNIDVIIREYSQFTNCANKIISAKRCYIANPVKITRGYYIPEISPDNAVPEDSLVRLGFPLILDNKVGDVDIQSLKSVNYKDPQTQIIEPGLCLSVTPSGQNQQMESLFPKWVPIVVVDKRGDIYYLSQD